MDPVRRGAAVPPTDYRHTADRIVRDLGSHQLEAVTPEIIERWRATLTVSNRTVAKYLVILHGIFRRAVKVWGLPRNPLTAVERPRFRVSDDLEAFSPEEVWALVRAASSERDAALYLMAAFTGLRMGELLALEWRDIDYAGEVVRVRRSYNVHGGVGSPKSGKVRSVSLVPDVAQRLAVLASREDFTTPEDLVFPGALGRHQDASSIRVRYRAALQRAELRQLRFHEYAAHVRHARRAPGRGAGGPGVDGPLRHPDHDALCPSPGSWRRCAAPGRGVPSGDRRSIRTRGE